MSTAEDKTSEKMSAKRKRQPTTKEAEKSIDRESKKHREQAPTLDSPKGLAPTGKTYYPSLDSEEEEGEHVKQSSLVSPDQSVEEEDSREDFPSLFFRDKHQHQAVPFIFDREKDGYELDPTQCDENCYSDLYAERNERRSLFARDLRSFKNGTSVFKHCLPWGQFNVLNNESFLIQMKFFNAYGEVTSIVLKDETTERIYSVEPKFFPGWSDPTCMKAYYDYCVSK